MPAHAWSLSLLKIRLIPPYFFLQCFSPFPYILVRKENRSRLTLLQMACHFLESFRFVSSSSLMVLKKLRVGTYTAFLGYYGENNCLLQLLHLNQKSFWSSIFLLKKWLLVNPQCICISEDVFNCI